MVFSSFEFIYLFLPPTLIGFLILRHLGWERGIVTWLILASLAFYAWWSVPYLFLLLGSVLANYSIYRLLSKARRRWIFGVGIVGNLLALAYFKYANFFVENVNAVSGNDFPLPDIILPLAISFFTFQQISFLCDSWSGRIERCDFLRYCLFVVFFPQLIAGPIVLQKDTIPQFRLSVFQSRLALNLSVGATLFAIGLFKKIVLADGVAPYANTVFGIAETTQGVPLEAAWIGALAYTFQIYFDFSGYCDMALGLARMFGIRLPINFFSPYKATSIVDFWRRWHITLSRFLRNYLYIPLGGSRKGPSRRYLNLFATMLLGGLWHGAAWNFVVWGALHGFYLTVNHAWGAITRRSDPLAWMPIGVRMSLARALTMLAVILAWVFFRAESFSAASGIVAGMSATGTVYEPWLWTDLLQDTGRIWYIFAGLAALVFWAPNSIEIVSRYRPVTDMSLAPAALARARSTFWTWAWRPTMRWATATGALALIAVFQLYRLGDLTEFIYFNF